jgi:hypothetical protein
LEDPFQVLNISITLFKILFRHILFPQLCGDILIHDSLIDFASKSINFFELEYPASAFHLIIPLFSISISKPKSIYLTNLLIPLNTILVGGYQQSQSNFVSDFCELIKLHQQPLFLLFPELLNKDDQNQIKKAISSVGFYIEAPNTYKPLFIFSGLTLKNFLPKVHFLK